MRTERPALTPRQQGVLLHMRGQMLVTGTIPSNRELARLCGITHGRVGQVLVRLGRLGYIERMGSRAVRFL